MAHAVARCVTPARCSRPSPRARAARPDFIKASTTAFSEWHYIDLPYAPDGDGGAAPACGGEAQNIVWALENAAAVLRSPRSDPWSRSTMLRFMIHFMGDVHQARAHASRCVASLHYADARVYRRPRRAHPRCIRRRHARGGAATACAAAPRCCAALYFFVSAVA